MDEANAAAEIKKEKPIMVVLGNPPYSGLPANASKRIVKDYKTQKIKTEFTWIGKLIEDYKMMDGQPLGEKNPKMLHDDYVKFIRFGQWRIERTGQGVLGFITNHGYLDNPTFRGMRQSLMNTFTSIYILNLHGNTKKKEVTPEGGKDENVFDIQQGVAICLLVKESGNTETAKVHYAELWGVREGKYQALLETDINDTEWAEIEPHSPYYLFVPRNETDLDEYMKGWKITDVLPVNSVGIVTSRDELTIRWSKKDVEETINDFASLPPEEARDKYKLGKDVRDWKVTLAQKDLKDSGITTEKIVPILYRPFDIRYSYYTGHSRGYHCMPRGEVMRHMLAGKNFGFNTTRQVTSLIFNHIICTDKITEYKFTSHDRNSYLFPLYLYPAEGEMQFGSGNRRPNLNPEFVKDISDKLGLKFIEDGKGDLDQTFGPEDVFNYAYAVFHSPTYRTRYAEFLKMDFPRLPLTSNKEFFKALAGKGAELVSLHLMESPALDNLITKYSVSGSNMVERVDYNETEHRVYINKTQYFEGVPPEVWNFHIGGYQVCQKWLKDRKGRTLPYDDLTHYQKVVVALNETIRLMAEIDEVIDKYGGWPGAFV